ncbi:MAG: cofactor-independent phosphoglycerate mutase [Peptostreptococcaceae bacterium]|nr:cofactor-independent phosphoglycerate mutase [Peptostreptococcaceae bacterium]MDY5739858.1 cofactor-independent phosphoglycerate mutase [Anaerovoracaceae bacterium]
MKYLIVVPDGAGDENIKALGDKTPLEYAKIPCIDSLAEVGEVGTVKTIPDGIAPGSDAANLSVMGYDPSIYLTGRSPLEAASIGVPMSDTDVAYRANFVTLTGDGEYEELVVSDHSSGDITTAEAAVLIDMLNNEFATDKIKFWTGTSYRHCLIVKEGKNGFDMTPPHDILEKKAGDYLPKGEGSEFITEMMKKSYELMKNHPINIKRIAEGKNPANSLWIWGQGTKPTLTSFFDNYGIKGTAISAVDLIKGIAIYAGLEVAEVPGATGTLDTDFEGKAEAAIEAFENGQDFVYLHVEGPDECSHQGNMQGKIQCIEDIDKRILTRVLDYLRKSGEDFKILEVPDHKTPLAIRTHSSTPVPFVLYDSRKTVAPDKSRSFNEKSGLKGSYFDSGHSLAKYFFTGE